MQNENQPRIIPPMPGASPAGVVPPEELTPVATMPSGGIEEIDEPAQPPLEETASEPTAEAGSDLPVEDDRPVRVVTRPPSDHVNQRYPVLDPLSDPWNDDAVALMIPGETRRRVEEVLNTMSDGEQQAIAENARWMATAGAGLADTPLADMNASLSDREGSLWEQVVHVNGRALGISRPKIGDGDNAILRGTAARTRMRSQLGMGTEYRVPLWHSGFWITVRSPGEDQLLELDRKLSEEKIALGRATTGLLYSNASVFNVNHITQFVLDQIVSTTLKNGTRTNIERLISIHDIQTLAWGMACAVWPNGFQYARAILGKVPAENRVVEGKINVSKLQWTDTAAFTETQLAHMANITTGAMTDDAVIGYQKTFAKRMERRVELRDGTAVTLQVPSLQDHVTVGQRWVNDIVTMTDKVFGMDQDPDARRAYISNQGKATMLRQYAHWIKYAEMGTSSTDQENRDEEALAGILDDLSSDDTIRNAILKAVSVYAEDTTVSFIAVPTADEREENIFAPHPHLLPLDALSTFFTLLRQKLQLILMR